MDGATNSYVGSVLKKRSAKSRLGEQRVRLISYYNYQIICLFCQSPPSSWLEIAASAGLAKETNDMKIVVILVGEESRGLPLIGKQTKAGRVEIRSIDRCE